MLSYYNVNTTLPILDAFLNFNKNPTRKDTRNFKGYKWEMLVKDAVNKMPSIKYEGNPTNFYNWSHEHNKTPYDGIVTLPNGKQITIEIKYRDCKKVYHSWFIDCWLPRKADVFITNNTNVISYEDKRTMDSQHKKLMSLSEFTVYLGKILRNILHPRKYLYFNRILIDIITVITRLFIISLGVSKQVFDRFYWLEVKFLLKRNETMFFENKISGWMEKFVSAIIFQRAFWINFVTSYKEVK